MMIAFLSLAFAVRRPWKVSDPTASDFIGVGAFNMVRRNAFSGSVLTAKVVPMPGAEVSSLPARLRAYCAERMESAAVPASIVPLCARGTMSAGWPAG